MLYEISLGKNQTPFIISSPLMAFEYLGYKMRDFDPYRNSQSIKNDITDQLFALNVNSIQPHFSLISKTLFGWFKNHPQLSLFEQKQRFCKELEYRTYPAKELFKNILEPLINDPNYHDALIRDLTNDRIQTLPYPEILENEKIKEIDLAFLATFAENVIEISRIPLTRMSDNFVERAERGIIRKSNIKCPYSLNDTLDTEIVHYALIGHGLRKNSVAVFSSEKIHTWIPRIQRYIHILRFLNEVRTHNHMVTLINICPGLIFQVDGKTGEISKNYIDVKKEFNLSGLVFDQN